MTRFSSIATKRRGAMLAAAVGVLTLGATASASAAGPSHTASVGGADVVMAKASKHCVITAGKAVPAAEVAKIEKGTREARVITRATKGLKVVEAGRTAKAAKAAKAAKVIELPKGIKIIKNGDG
ncbi:hypothetical protein AB4Z54_25865, partial [Streptomyces sp. MCAF7]